MRYIHWRVNIELLNYKKQYLVLTKSWGQTHPTGHFSHWSMSVATFELQSIKTPGMTGTHHTYLFHIRVGKKYTILSSKLYWISFQLFQSDNAKFHIYNMINLLHHTSLSPQIVAYPMSSC